METEQLSILFYNADRGVEFSMSFNGMAEYQHARKILITMGLLERTDSECHVNINDEKFAAFGKSLADG